MNCRRRGASLAELLVVVSILTGILSLVGTVFHRLLQSERNSTRAALIELTTSRLADQFRRDVHASQVVGRNASQEQSLPLLELSHPSEVTKIRYIGGRDKVEREVFGSEGKIARETFRLPSCVVTFPNHESDASSPESQAMSREVIAISIARPPSLVMNSVQMSPRLRNLIIEAELGRDQRLATGKLASEVATTRKENE